MKRHVSIEITQHDLLEFLQQRGVEIDKNVRVRVATDGGVGWEDVTEQNPIRIEWNEEV